MDHVQGLPFFAPFRRPGVEVHLWGPASTTQNLEARLHRYLSPPLFPVRVRDLLSTVHFHEIAKDTTEIGEFRVTGHIVIHQSHGGWIEEGNMKVACQITNLQARMFPRNRTSDMYLHGDLLIMTHSTRPEYRAGRLDQQHERAIRSAG
jgi:phosphoribosyl 1,2-cyclic phosphodiesterase